MPVHDWSRVSAGIFHDFHVAWVTHLKEALNNGVLPAEYYALAEQVTGPVGPDVLTLSIDRPNGSAPPNGASSPTAGAPVSALPDAPPQVRFRVEAGQGASLLRRRRVVIRHTSGDEVIAMIEVVSPGNKNNENGLRTFVRKASEILASGVHLLILDLIPPGPRDPQGVHGAIWADLGEPPYEPPADKPLTLVGYRATPPPLAFIEPVAVGDALTDMPLFIDPESYVNVPVEATYTAAYRGVPARWRAVVEG